MMVMDVLRKQSPAVKVVQCQKWQEKDTAYNKRQWHWISKEPRRRDSDKNNGSNKVARNKQWWRKKAMEVLNIFYRWRLFWPLPSSQTQWQQQKRRQTVCCCCCSQGMKSDWQAVRVSVTDIALVLDIVPVTVIQNCLNVIHGMQYICVGSDNV